MPRCLKCDRTIEPAARDVRPAATICGRRWSRRELAAWNMPAGAVCLEGGWSFGSRVYDAAIGGGPAVRVLICDPCIQAAVASGAAMEYIPDPPAPAHKRRRSLFAPPRSPR